MHNLSDEITRKFQDVIETNDEWEIDTDTGWQPVGNIMKTIPYDRWDLSLSNGMTLSGADEHIIFDENLNEVFLKDLANTSKVMTQEGPIGVTSIINRNKKEEMFDIEVLSNNHRYFTNGILSHNTTCAAGYLLWFAMFNSDSTILVAAHKYTGAQEIMQRIRYAYENTPDHIRCGVTSYNKGSIEFDNGSRIVSATTTETTGRGMAISLLYCDEYSFVRPTIAKEFWTSISPTLSTGGKAIVTSTPNSDEDQFAEIWKVANHKFDEYGNETAVGKNGFAPIMFSWDRHPERTQSWADQERASIGDDRFKREHECISGKSLITIKTPEGIIKQLTIEEFYQLLLNKDLFVVELAKNKKGYQILTDNGWSNFDSVALKGKNFCYKVSTRNYSLEATIDHEFYTTDMIKKPINSLKVGDLLNTISGLEKITSIEKMDLQPVYDIINVQKSNRFYSNGLLVSNCKFIIFDETLIAPSKLAIMEGVNPLEKQGQVRWYDKPKSGHIFAVALDPSLGTGGDPAAIQVWDLTTMKQIAEWQHNLTIIQRQVSIVTEICKYIAEETDDITNIYYTVENNSIGEAALNAITDIGEENISGIFLSESNTSRRKGFNTTHRSKLAACAKMKLWIESDKMKINSKSLISELKNFVAIGNSYKAKLGETDDLVMATILIVRIALILKNYDSDLNGMMTDSLEDIIEPMPFIII